MLCGRDTKVAVVLSEIRITGLGVIDDAALSLSDGFTVVTGETGAGKTMVVAGLGLLFGGRADAARVRNGSDKAVVEGLVRPPDSDDMRHSLTALGIDLPDDLDDGGALPIARTVHANGRSRGHVAGRSAPVGFLAELGERLVTVHGQSDQLRLLRPSEQRGALDRFGGEAVAGPLAQVRDLFGQWRAVSAELVDRTEHARQRAQEADVLRHGLAEIEAVDPQPGEDIALRGEAERLEHAEALRAVAALAHEAMSGDPAMETSVDVASLLGTARKALEEQSAHDSALEELGRRMDEVAALAGDLAADLASYVESIEADPARLAVVHERRAALSTLTRKYADDVDAVLAWAREAQQRLVDLDTSEETLAQLRMRRDALAEQLREVALKLSAARGDASERFGKAVTAELAGLAMPHAEVTARVSHLASVKDQPCLEIDGVEVGVTADGIDEVELCLTQPGSAPLPIHKGASGGELSRIMLAIEVVFADVGEQTTMIFDEVDAGVGGRAAVEIGRRLARLAQTHQVLVVTHLPQVAAFADHHVVVEKNSDGSVTTSGLREARDGERVKELARMLAGLDESDLGLAHAQELLNLAQSHVHR